VFCMARTRGVGSCGVKVGNFRFKQPKGMVRIISSKVRVWLSSVVMETFGDVGVPVVLLMSMSLVLKWILALVRAVLATARRIAEWLLATKKFSIGC
jgi:phage-related minor tail protein